MSRYPVRVTAVLLAALALVALPAGSHLTAQGKGTIKIATQSPLSGGQAALGEGIKLGTQLAVEKFKVNLEMISPANTNPTITDRGYASVYRVCGRDDVQGVVGSEFAHATLKAKTAFVIHDKTTYGQGVAEFFKADAEKKGIKVLGFEGTEEKSNFDPIITPIKAKNPDLIYFGGIYEQAGPFFKQAREKGVKSKFLGPDGMDSSDLTKIGGKAVVGMHYTSVAGPVSVYPQAKQFAEDYKKKFGKNPEPFAAQAYDATAIAVKAIEATAKGGKAPTREAVTAAIRGVRHTGITGSVEFDAKGDPKKALYFVLQVVSDNPEKWGDNKEVKRLVIAAPSK